MPVYSYSELKGKIRVGDTVRAVPGKSNGCSEMNPNGSNTAKITDVGDTYFGINRCVHRFTEKVYLEIVRSEITPKNCMVGDVIERGDGTRRTVLAHTGKIIFLSDEHDQEENGYFISESGVQTMLDDDDWHFVQPNDTKEIKEVTMKEVCEKFGCEVKIKEEE